jgi:cell division protein FtsQ
MKRIVHISLFSIFIIAVFGLMGFIYIENARQNIEDVKVRIVRDNAEGFLTKEEILGMVEQFDSLTSKTVKEVRIKEIENKIALSPFVEQADVFINVDKNLVINVDEKRPFLRVFNRYGMSFYLDQDGKPFPLNDNYASLVPVASGYINLEMDERHGIPVEEGSEEILSSLYKLNLAIGSSDFLRAQVNQIYLNSKGEYDLIPEVGNHVVQLGTLENLEDKLNRLELWYRKSFTMQGGDKYSTISLKYQGQVVCTKKK